MWLNRITKSEPCPCGSEKKYKQCCLSRKDVEHPIEKLMSNPGYLNHFVTSRIPENNVEVCLHPNQNECIMPIKKAHALQNNGVLSRIAVNNHVMVVKHKASADGPSLEMESESKNKATTFTGFCEKHDTEVFRPIEVYDYASTKEQNFLFAYRAFANQYHKSQVVMNTHRQLAWEKPSLLREDEGFVALYRNRQLELKDLDEYKEIFDRSLVNRDLDVIETATFILPFEIRFAVCAAFALGEDIEGNQLNNLLSFEPERLKSIFITLLPGDNETYILFSWLKDEAPVFARYKSQLEYLTTDELMNYLNVLIPKYTENIVMSPLLWNQFNTFKKRQFRSVLLNQPVEDPKFNLFEKA